MPTPDTSRKLLKSLLRRSVRHVPAALKAEINSALNRKAGRPKLPREEIRRRHKAGETPEQIAMALGARAATIDGIIRSEVVAVKDVKKRQKNPEKSVD